jgi:hypothetical protein
MNRADIRFCLSPPTGRERRLRTELFTFVNFSSCPKSKGLKEKLGSYAREKMQRREIDAFARPEIVQRLKGRSSP